MKKCKCGKPIEYKARKFKEDSPIKVCRECAEKLKKEGYLIVTY